MPLTFRSWHCAAASTVYNWAHWNEHYRGEKHGKSDEPGVLHRRIRFEHRQPDRRGLCRRDRRMGRLGACPGDPPPHDRERILRARAFLREGRPEPAAFARRIQHGIPILAGGQEGRHPRPADEQHAHRPHAHGHLPRGMASERQEPVHGLRFRERPARRGP